MRTWTLAKDKRYWTMMRVHDCTAFPKDDEEFVRAIELEPVLDLLEEAGNALRAIKHWSGAGSHPIATPLAERIDPLLRAHGRLDG